MLGFRLVKVRLKSERSPLRSLSAKMTLNFAFLRSLVPLGQIRRILQQYNIISPRLYFEVFISQALRFDGLRSRRMTPHLGIEPRTHWTFQNLPKRFFSRFGIIPDKYVLNYHFNYEMGVFIGALSIYITFLQNSLVNSGNLSETRKADFSYIFSWRNQYLLSSNRWQHILKSRKQLNL